MVIFCRSSVVSHCDKLRSWHINQFQKPNSMSLSVFLSYIQFYVYTKNKYNIINKWKICLYSEWKLWSLENCCLLKKLLLVTLLINIIIKTIEICFHRHKIYPAVLIWYSHAFFLIYCITRIYLDQSSNNLVLEDIL